MSDQNRRTNKPLKGLLDFCTSVTSGEDGTEPSVALDPQRKEFMQEVLGRVTSQTAEKEVKETLIIITNIVDSQDWTEDHITATEHGLQYILDYTSDTPDNGKFLIQMGAVGQLFALMDRFETSEMVATSCEIVAEVAQNDEDNQALLATEENIVKLMALAESYAEEKVTEKALYAVKSILRENEAALGIFAENKGFCWLNRMLLLGKKKITVKVSLLAIQLLRDYKQAKVCLLETGFSDTLSRQLCTPENNPPETSLEYDAFKEHGTAALVKMCRSEERFSDVLKQSTGFGKYVQDRARTIAQSAAHEEELQHLDGLTTMMKLNDK